MERLNKNMQSNKKVIIIALAAVLVLLVAVIYFNRSSSPSSKKIVDNSNPSISNVNVAPVKSQSVQEKVNADYALNNVETLKAAQVEIVGASPVNPENKVMTYEGKVADNSVAPGSALAPKQTQSITKAELPAGTISLNVSAAGFSPKEFSVTAGAPVNLSLTSTDKQVHVFMFDDISLKAVAIGVMPGETKAMTFNAPGAGTYTFRCDVPEHKQRGEVGTMTVK